MKTKSSSRHLETDVIIPVKSLNRIKSRLSSYVSLDNRKKLNLLMLSDVLAAISGVEEVRRTLIVSSDKEVLRMAKTMGADVVPEEGDFGVNLAVKTGISVAAREGVCSVLVLPSDIPLISPVDVCSIISLQTTSGIVITPSTRFDGTNALLMNPPKVISTFYDQQSFYSHARMAISKQAKVAIYLSRNIMLDIDSREDLEELSLTDSKCESAQFCRQLCAESILNGWRSR